MEAVAGYQPVAPATLKGWTYGIKGFENKPVAGSGQKICQPSKVTAEPFGVQAELRAERCLVTAELFGRLRMSRWRLSTAIPGVVR